MLDIATRIRIREANPAGTESWASLSDTWFAWYPVRVGALGTGSWRWMCRLWRNRCLGVTIYQDLED